MKSLQLNLDGGNNVDNAEFIHNLNQDYGAFFYIDNRELNLSIL